MPAEKVYSIQLTPFEERVRTALETINKHKELDKSPLSSPYFLSHLFDKPEEAMIAEERIKKLREILRTAILALWNGTSPNSAVGHDSFHTMKASELLAIIEDERNTPGTTRYAYLILYLQYLDEDQLQLKRLMDAFDKTHLKNYKKVKTSNIWDYLLLISKNTYYRALKVAIRQVSEVLLKHFSPPLLHAPLPPRPQNVVGYEAIQTHALNAIDAGQSVALIGAGGSGKTTMAAEIAHRCQLQGKLIFWFTLRPTFNDHLDSLLFSLGHFLSKQGAVNLWRFLLAHLNRNAIDHDPKKNESALLLAKADLATLRNNPPLLCFDELDRLYDADAEAYSAIHQQMLEFIEGLRTETPMLLLGQRAVIATDKLLLLDGLAAASIDALWRAWGLSLSEQQLTQLMHLTKGNPRLLNICLVLHESGESIEHILATLPNKPILAPFFDKLWTRLAVDEKKRRLLLQLAVFHDFAPATHWQRSEPETYKALLIARLLQEDGKGGVAIVPAFREVIYSRYVIDPTLRANLHIAAAEIRREVAEYTAAAYHYWQADRIADAVRVWFPQMAYELQRGQASVAWNIFRQIPPHRLSAATQASALALIQGELSWLQADLPGGLARLQAIQWDGSSELTLRAKALQADFQDALGYPEAAVESYSAAINLIGRLVHQASTMLFQRGRIQRTQQKELTAADYQMHLIEFEWRRMQGVLHEANGRYREATIAYQTGLAIASNLDELEKVAWAETSLARLLGIYLQRTDEAEHHLRRAITIYQQRGDVINQARTQANLTNLLHTAHNYHGAIATGVPAYQSLRTFQDTRNAAALGATLAEAYFEVGDFDNAQRYAQQVLEDLEDRHAYPYVLYTLGRIKKQHRDTWHAAQRDLEDARRIAKDNRDPFILAYLHQELGQLYFDKTDYPNARQEWESALALFEQQGLSNEGEQTRHLLLQLPRNGTAM